MDFYVPCSRSDSDSEGENPEKKKLQEQLMGEWPWGDLTPSCGAYDIISYNFLWFCHNQPALLINCIPVGVSSLLFFFVCRCYCNGETQCEVE